MVFDKLLGCLVSHKHKESRSLLYEQRTAVTISNTVVASSFFNDTDCIGSRTIKANTVKVGDIFILRTNGDFSCIGNPTNTIEITIGSTSIIASTAQLINNVTNQYAGIYLEIQVVDNTALGNVIAMGRTELTGGNQRPLLCPVPLGIDWSVDNIVNVTYAWGAANASNILTNVFATVEKLSFNE